MRFNQRDGTMVAPTVDVGFEKVGHARAVADVSRRRRRSPWFAWIFRDSGFDLADQVGADVGGLGKDAAAETKIEISERQASATSASTTVRSSPPTVKPPGPIRYQKNTRSRAGPDRHQHAGDRVNFGFSGQAA